MPFLLPHDTAVCLEHGDANFILSRDILEEDRALLRAHAEAREPARDPATILPLGLWSDGVPCNWDRCQSLESIALTLPSIPGYRFPLFCIKKAFQVKQTTMDPACKSCSADGFGTAPQSQTRWLQFSCCQGEISHQFIRAACAIGTLGAV